MKIFQNLAALVATLVLGAIVADAQPARQNSPGRGRGAGNDYSRIYNPETVETVKGQVESVDKMSPVAGMGQGVHVTVKTDSGEIPVHLGPSWFMEHQDTQIEPKDEIEVTGSRVTFEGKPTIIASEVKKDGGTLRLRDENGRPAWAGWTAAGAERGRPMGRGMMNPENRKRMMEQRQKMMSEIQARDEELQKKVDAMNKAEGQAKIDAMADVIDTLVKERQEMHERASTMQERMQQRRSPDQEDSAPSRDQ